MDAESSALPPGLWRAARDALTRDLDAEERRAQPELARQNVARFLALEPLLLLGHALGLATSLGWARWGDFWSVAFAIHAVTIALNLPLLGAALRARRRRGAFPAWFGDVTVLVYCAFGLAISTNGQRVGASADLLNFALFSTAVLFRARLSTAIVAFLGSASVFAVTVELLQHALEARRAVLTTTVAVALVAFGFSRLLVRTELREIAGRRLIADQKAELEASKIELEARKEELEARQEELERLNEALERKVEVQLGEIVQRSQEVEALDAQLRVKVRGRAKDLVRALRDASPRADTPMLPGTRFAGRVVIRRLLGQGGMGEVYLGDDVLTGRQVAVKRIRTDGPADDATLQRFAAEATALSAVDHPGVVRCLHVDVADDGGLYLLMEYVKGSTLQEAQATGQLDLPAALRLGEGMASVLAAAHTAGVVHRDIKPGNVMLTAGTPGVRVLDFGISKVNDEPTHATKTGQIVGTPRYMAPEQFQEDTPVSGATDVYALGVVIHELVAGEPPFGGTSFMALVRAHLELPPPRLDEVREGVPAAVADVVAECLRKEPSSRPAAADVERRLREAAEAMGAAPVDATAAKLAEAGRLRAAFDLDAVVHELAHAIARPPDRPRTGGNRPSSAPTAAATAPTAARRR